MNTNESLHIEVNENMVIPPFEVTRISDGLGFGSGTIDGIEGSDPETLSIVDQTIRTSREIIVQVGLDENGMPVTDDGCGDGRIAGIVMRGKETLKRSLHRAKVFGGGLAMTMAARIGLGKSGGKDLYDVFSDAAADADAKGLDYGAHTDDHAHGESCGCGAIDKAPEAISNAVKYQANIQNVITDLGVSNDGLNDVFAQFADYNSQVQNSSYSGSKVMELIRSKNRIIKQLLGAHKEKMIILNMVEGTTVNQQLIRDASGDKADVFVTDVWRLQQIAAILEPDDEAARHNVLQSELVYTLAVAGTLTKGNLPVYLITKSPVPEEA